MTADLRLCPSPQCGGYLVRPANEEQMVCPDGAIAAECHVGRASWSSVGMTPAEITLLHNRMARTAVLVRAELITGDAATPASARTGQLLATEAWLPATDRFAWGSLYAVHRNRFDGDPMPLDTACFAYRQVLLNHNDTAWADRLDFTLSGATAEQIAAALRETTRYGVMVAGASVRDGSQTCARRTLLVTQFYLPMGSQAERACGGFYYRPCLEGEWCDISVPNACSGADLPGVCKVLPGACTTLYDPVCGCDGQTYSNDCVRLAARVQLDHRGPCAE